MNHFYLVISLFLFFTFCSEKQENEIPLSSTILFEEPIPEHPRLLFSKADEEKLNHYGLEIHRFVFDYKSFEFRPRSIKSEQLKLRSLKYRFIPG